MAHPQPSSVPFFFPFRIQPGPYPDGTRVLSKSKSKSKSKSRDMFSLAREYRTSRDTCAFVCAVTQQSFGGPTEWVPRSHQPGFAADWTIQVPLYNNPNPTGLQSPTARATGPARGGGSRSGSPAGHTRGFLRVHSYAAQEGCAMPTAQGWVVGWSDCAGGLCKPHWAINRRCVLFIAHLHLFIDRGAGRILYSSAPEVRTVLRHNTHL